MTRAAFLFYILATSLALIVIKLSTNAEALLTVHNGQLLVTVHPLIFLGIVLYGISFLLYTYLLAHFNLGFIVPVTTALVYIIVFTASFLFFKESFTTGKVIGIGFIIVGLLLLNSTKDTFRRKRAES